MYFAQIVTENIIINKALKTAPYMKTAFIFAYKGHLGAEVDVDGKFLNSPTSPGQLGAVIDTKEVEITQEARDLIKSLGREGGSFAGLMLTKMADGSGSNIGILGLGKVNMGCPPDLKIGRTCDKEVVDDCELVDREVPEDYRKFIDEKVLVTA